MVPLTPELKLRIWHTTAQTNKYTLLLPGYLKYETSAKFYDAVATYAKHLTVSASSLTSSSRLLLEYNGAMNQTWPRTVVQRDELFESWMTDLCRVCAESSDLEVCDADLMLVGRVLYNMALVIFVLFP